MSESGISIESRRDMMREQIKELAEGDNYRYINLAGSSYSAEGLLVFLDAAAPGYLDQIQRQLNEMEDEVIIRARRDRAYEAEAAARNAPMTDEEQDDIDRTNQDVIARAKHAASTEGLLERLIELTERMVSALEKR